MSRKNIFGFLSLLLLMGSCDPLRDDLYSRPEWLEGKLYTQMKSQENISTFIAATEITGLSALLEKSGYYTVFAPTDEAFVQFFQQNPIYGGKLENIPVKELERLVRSHIIQNGWTLSQLQSLDIDGWIDPGNPNYNEARGYKRATLLQDSLKRYLVNTTKNIDRIVDKPSDANGYKTVVSTTRKYVPFFYPDYFRIKSYTTADYEFYFGRPYDNGVFIDGAKIISEEIPAENGFIYVVDKIINERKNIEQLLTSDTNQGKYSEFLRLIYRYPHFQYNADETNKQEGASLGLKVDSLFNLTYAPDLIVDIHGENTGPTSRYTIREQNTVIAPTNEALNKLYNEYVTLSSGYPHWPTINDMPPEILRIIANTHMSKEAVYSKEISEGFTNGESDQVFLDPSTIISKNYGSNGVLIGVNEAIVPRAFISVTGPVYLRPGYSIFMYALENTGILPALKRADKDYSLIIIPDFQLEQDSSLLLEWIDKDLNTYRFNVFSHGENRMKRIRQNELTLRIMNQIALGTPKNLAKKEFLETLAGNYVMFDHENGTVQGSIPSTYGYSYDSAISVFYQKLEEPTDNGITVSSNGWLKNGNTDVFNTLQSGYPKFLTLLDKAGLASKSNLKITMLSDGEFYTILAPTDSALNAIDADNIPLDSLQQILRHHFIKGRIIFTDGSTPDGDYETMKINKELSGQFVKVYEKLRLDTGPDYINILDKNSNLIYTIIEEGSKTNKLTFMRLNTLTSDSEFLEYDYSARSVIHEIKQVIISN